MRQALTRLANEPEASELNERMAKIIEGSDLENIEVLDAEVVAGLALDLSSTGSLEKSNYVELCTQLGIQQDGRIPGFNDKCDPLGQVSALVATTLPEEELEPLRPTWHQLVGILRMLELAFEGKPVLLMDEVGVGKTLQGAGFIAMLEFYRQYHSTHHKYPGAFGKSRSRTLSHRYSH